MPSAWWDEWETGETQAEPQDEAPDRELLPEGRHVLEIKLVDDDGQRLQVRLAPSERRYGWVFCRLPHGQSWAGRIAASLARALGVTAAGWDEAVQSGDLVGRRVEARVYHRATATGTWVNVGEFHAAAEEPKPTRAPAARRAEAAKASDDIPF